MVRIWVHNGVKFDTFGVSFVKCSYCVHKWAQRMCPHASGVMLLGARGFFTHFISPCVQYRAILGPQWCQVLCTTGIVTSKNVPACVRGYAGRRPGIFYTFYFTLCAVWYDFGSTMVSSLCKFCVSVRIVCTSGLKECARMRPR